MRLLFGGPLRRCLIYPAIALGSTILLSTGTAQAQLPGSYTITNLGTLGGLTSFALDINNVGQITGNAQTPTGQASPRLNAFLWESSGPMQNLGVLPGSNNFSRGYSINDSGWIVGESDNNSSRAFLYKPGEGLTNLGGLSGPSGSGVAHGINNSGVIVGASSNGTAARAFVRSANGIMRDVGSLDGLTTTPARAWAVSDTGYIAGLSRTGVGTTSHAFLFRDANNNGLTDPGELIDLDAGASDPTRTSQAYGVNDAGTAVGSAVVGFTSSGTPITNPYVWIGGASINLGTLGQTFGQAMDINNAGIVVGNTSLISGLADKAFVWTSSDGMKDLTTLISPGSGWTLRSAEGINNKGQIIGYGTFNGNTTAYLLTPVSASEPGAFLLLLLALPVLALKPVLRR